MAPNPTPSRKLRILAFPEELQVLILADLEIDDLLACQQVTRCLPIKSRPSYDGIPLSDVHLACEGGEVHP